MAANIGGPSKSLLQSIIKAINHGQAQAAPGPLLYPKMGAPAGPAAPAAPAGLTGAMGRGGAAGMYSVLGHNPNQAGAGKRRESDARFRSFAERYVAARCHLFRTGVGDHAVDQWECVQDAKRVYKMIERVGHTIDPENLDGKF